MTNEKTPRHDIESYNEQLQKRTKEIREIAEVAKQNGEDPKPKVEIDQADDIAERCEMLLREEIDGLTGLQEKIRHYEENTDLDREEISFKIADDLVDGEIGDNLDERERVEAAVRSAIAILTEGVVAAPIEGIGEVTIEENDDGTDYIRIHYNGPIRSAGGTGQALSVLVADHVRQGLGMASFKPRDNEVERYKEEIKLYNDDTGLQYMPKDKEIVTIIKNCPVMLDGMQTVQKEVAGYRDLERIDGNRPRGGVCLVAAEGLAQKAPKMKRIVDGNNIKGWDWLTDLSTVTTTEDDDDDEDENEDDSGEEEEEIEYSEHKTQDLIEPDSIDHPVFEPTKKFQKDITGGRPIFSGPSRRGGLRLRYGRARNTGIASSGFHPATMIATDEFLSTGVQQKTERPGKATGTAPVDGIEGPTVRLEDGTVIQFTSEKQARENEDRIEYIIDLGEMLVNYGEFLENNHPLAPSPYTPEWWIQDLENAGMPTDNLDPNKVKFETALNMSKKWDIPIHPDHTYLFSDITPEKYTELAQKLQTAEEIDHDIYDYEIDTNEDVNETLEHLLVNHKQNYDGEEHTTTYLHEDDYERLNYYFDPELETEGLKNGITCVNEAIDPTVMPRVTTRIGSRMGRPEKSDYRSMKPPVHGLFPVGTKGGKGRQLFKAANNTDGSNKNVKTGRANDDYKGQGIANIQLSNRICTNCNESTWKVKCPNCNERTNKIAQCYNCGNIKRPELEGEECESCYNGNLVLATRQQLDINKEVNDALETLGETKSRLPTRIKGVEGLVSASKVPEPVEKTILRGKYDVYPFRDSTVRYDMVDLPLTSFRVDEVIGLDIETAHDLGYTHDLDGNELEEDQLTEIYPQDIVVSEDCGDYLLRAANYIDQLLEDYYGVNPYYRADSKEDLIGKLVIGLAPHTSAGVMSRLIGFSDSKAQLGHPVFHAAKRRNTDGDEDAVFLALDGFLNFSREYLPDAIGKRSVTKDTPVYVNERGDEGQRRIDELFEIYAEDIDSRPDGWEVAEIADDLQVISFDTDTGEISYKEPSKIMRHPNDKNVYEINTELGGSIKMTGDHGIFVHQNGEIVNYDARDLEEGDQIVVPENLSVTELSEAKEVENIVGDVGYEEVSSIEKIDYGDDYVYDLEVPDNQNFLCGPHPIFAHNTMDAPLVVTAVIDPTEIDDEAHMVDVVDQYSRDFYLKSWDMPGPKEVDVDIIEDMLGGDIKNVRHTMETSSVNAGPYSSRYPKLEGMQNKVNSQLALAAKSRSVEEKTVASKVIDKHFFPDIRGNLRAYAQQDFRCTKCETKFRRLPLTGECPECADGGNLIFTVHEGMIRKYMQPTLDIAEKYEVDEYVYQQLEEIESELDSIFEMDTEEQTGLDDFM